MHRRGNAHHLDLLYRERALPHIGKPCFVHHLSRQFSVDVRVNELLKGKGDLMVFAVAIGGALWREIFLFHDIGEQDGVGAVGHA